MERENTNLNKKGAVNWTVGKLVGVIVAVLVLVLVIYMISSGTVPNVERIEGYFDKVLVMLNFDIGEGVMGFGEDCREREPVESYAGGGDFLKTLELGGKKVNLVVCTDAVCGFEGGGLNLYRVDNENFEKLQGDEWHKYDTVMSGDMKEIKRNWRFYDAFLNLSGSGELRDIYDSGISGRLVLYGDGSGISDNPVYAIWESGEWSVVEAFPELDEKYKRMGENKMVKERWFGFRTIVERDVYYKGSDTDEALDAFVGRVRGGDDDKVYWKVEAATIGDVEYLGGVDYGRSIGDLISDTDRAPEDFNNKYNSIVSAEHRTHYDVGVNGLMAGYDPWVRTKTKSERGSSAYGPAQLTKGLAENYLKNKKIVWTEDEKDYLERFIDQGWKFLAHGGGELDVNQVENNLDEYERLGINVETKYDSNFDYGGSGELTSEEDKLLYKRVVVKMLEDMYVRHDNDREGMWREWRFGLKNFDKEDSDYGDIFNLAWILGIREYSSGDIGDYDEIDSDTDVYNLGVAVEKIITRLIWEAQLDKGDVEDMRKLLEGKSLRVTGKDYLLKVEDNEEFPIISFVVDGERFGFMHDGNALAMSGFLENVKLRYFPVKLIGWSDGYGWDEIGNEEYYRLPEKNFREVFEASVSEAYLKRICR